jgi:flagellar assembly protein FliH
LFEKRIKPSGAVRKIRPMFFYDSDYPSPSSGTNKKTDVKVIKKNSQAILEKATKRAYQRGIMDGRNEGQAQLQHELDYALDAVHSAFRSLEQYEKEFLAKIELTVLNLALAIVKKVIQKEISVDDDIIRNVVVRALDMIKGENRIVVKINPGDKKVMENHWESIKELFKNIAEWKLETSANVNRGGCLVETPNETIDARIERQLELIETYLQEGLVNADSN